MTGAGTSRHDDTSVTAAATAPYPTTAGAPAPASPRYEPGADKVAHQLGAVTGWDGGTVTAAAFADDAGYSLNQARHVLNFAAETGYVEKLRSKPGGGGAWYVFRPVARACRACGCTPEKACPGGCWWAEFDLCTRCTPRSGDNERTPVTDCLERCPTCGSLDIRDDGEWWRCGSCGRSIVP